MAEFGYAGHILEVDLSSGRTNKLATADYADRFIGGRGIAARLYWDRVTPQIKAFDPENCLIFMTGPVAGFPRLAGARWQVCSKSPAMEPQNFSYGNLGGSWGVWLKFAGYDGLVVTGKADKPVYLYVHDGKVDIKDASHLRGKTGVETREMLKAELGKQVRVLATSPAGEHLVIFANILADEDSTGSSGFGSVLGSKNIKAIAAVGDSKPTAAHPNRMKELADRIFRLRKGTWEPYTPAVAGKTRVHACYGCISGCMREDYTADGGEHSKFFCQASDTYRRHAVKYYGGWHDVIFHATRLCNEYGLDTAVVQPMIDWLARCYQQGVLRDEDAGMPLSKIGSAEFIEAFVGKVAWREGFGDVLAQGTFKAAELIGKGAKELIGDSIATRANEGMDYDPRLYITTGLLYALEPRRPIQQIHEITLSVLQWLEWFKGSKGPPFLTTKVLQNIAQKFWGGRIAADFSTFEGKALAARVIQNREYAKESLILCDFLWPIIWVRHSDDHVGDPTLESQVFSAVTGRETDEQGLYRFGERILNLQRAILMREGWGGRAGDKLLDFVHEQPLQTLRFNRDCQVPGKDGEIISKKGAVLERAAFELMKDELYQLRGWDVPSGFQTRAKLVELGLGDVAGELERQGLLRG